MRWKWWLAARSCLRRTNSLLRMRWSLDTPGISPRQWSQRAQRQAWVKNIVMNCGKDSRCTCTIYQLFKMTLPYNHFVTFCYGHSDHFDPKAFDHCDDLLLCIGQYVFIIENKGLCLGLFRSIFEWGLRPFGKSSETFWTSISNPFWNALEAKFHSNWQVIPRMYHLEGWFRIAKFLW